MQKRDNNSTKGINRVGLTGIDDFVDFQEIADIYELYPFLEFGVCYDNPQNEQLKYSGYRLAQKLRSNYDFPLVAHLSERNVEQFIYTLDVDFLKDIKWERIQINAEINSREDLHKIIELAKKLAEKIDFYGQIILPENHLIRPYFESTHIPSFIDILSDVSGGKGIQPTVGSDWPTAYSSRFGFAGGIKPHNIIEVIQSLEKKIKPTNEFIWIDMESSLKCPDSGQFDIAQVLLAAQNAEVFINPQYA